MRMLPLAGLAAALALLAACDSRDVEAELEALRAEFSEATESLKAAVTDNETLNRRIEELQTELAEIEAPEISVDALEAQLDAVAEAANNGLERLDRLADEGSEAAAAVAEDLREDLNAVLASVQDATAELTSELDGTGNVEAPVEDAPAEETTSQ